MGGPGSSGCNPGEGPGPRGGGISRVYPTSPRVYIFLPRVYPIIPFVYSFICRVYLIISLRFPILSYYFPYYPMISYDFLLDFLLTVWSKLDLQSCQKCTEMHRKRSKSTFVLRIDSGIDVWYDITAYQHFLPQ